MTARSPLDTLVRLRQQTHDSRRTSLLTQAERERNAELEKERARQLLAAETREREAARQQEAQRLREQGITAAEGQRRASWERARRESLARLSGEHERAVDSHRQAVVGHERARAALTRADAELRVVRERIEQSERARQRGEELAQQEVSDESSLRRFVERNRA